MNHFADVNMVIYHDNYLVAVWKPDHLGFMGVYLKNLFLCFPVGTQLDVCFVRSEKNNIEEERVPMVVNKSGFDGTGLRLKSFERESVNKWKTLLLSVISPLVTTKYH